MQVFQKIVCAVDFSETSRQALRFAAALARGGPAALHVVHVNYSEPPAYFTSSQLEQLQQQDEQTRAEAESALRAFVAASITGEASSIRILEGAIADSVAEFASEVGADLLVIGTHGRTGFNRLMLGSVAEKLIRMLPVPVLTVRHGVSSELALRHILVPVNNTPMARKALQTAADIAASVGADLTVLHVRESGVAAPKEDICSWVAGGKPAAGCELRELSREGDPATEIIRAATDLGAGLIVLGASHKRFFDTTVLGTTVTRVTRHAPVPVLVTFTSGVGQTTG